VKAKPHNFGQKIKKKKINYSSVPTAVLRFREFANTPSPDSQSNYHNFLSASDQNQSEKNTLRF